MADRIRIRGTLLTTDATTALEVPIYREGTEDAALTIGANDTLSIDMAHASMNTNTSVDVFFSASGAFVEPAAFFRHASARPVQRAVFPVPAVGLPGRKCFVRTGGATVTVASITGWLQRG